MKKLIIVRHAKSSWKFNVIDHERPLNDRGVNDAHLVARCLSELRVNLDLLISSDAMRAKTTAEIFISELSINQGMVSFNHELYDFSGGNLVQVIKGCDSSINNLMVFGHNHAITAFVNTYGDTFIDNVPTSGVTIIEFDIENWKELNKGTTLKTIFPKDLKADK